ncbi:hypothetical protein GOP47_0011181 [Adiantum capillus-veneris]|uniref:Uncharacterized protein n=1 Tax=Adiantum capillus-veneris TaxID=13818 RepID=A0A9D4USB3_ADICA|nr:hypothetical protein GOP47_0011181 [Adiantum capillus-veneris]
MVLSKCTDGFPPRELLVGIKPSPTFVISSEGYFRLPCFRAKTLRSAEVLPAFILKTREHSASQPPFRESFQ